MHAQSGLTSVDPDAGDTFTYTMTSGTGSTDNASFGLVGNTLTTNAIFDFEVKNSYAIRVRSTDAGGLWTEKAFTVSVGDVNETPTNIALSASSVAENQPAGTTIGALSITDPDAGDTFTYTMANGTGDTNNASFSFVGNTLTTATGFDFETQNNYAIRVRSTDAGGLWTEKAFTISVTNVNEQPTDILLSSGSVVENLAAGTAVCTLSTTDPDTGNAFTYRLVSGTGSTDNASFNIGGGSLQTAASFNYESKNSYSIRLRTTDQDGLYFERQFTIGVTNVNEAPTDIALSKSSVAENLASGTTVGTLSATDPDAGNTFTYTMAGGIGSTDNASFNLVGSTLTTNASFDFEAKNSYAIRVRSTDGGGLWTEKAFTVSVTNVNEQPTDIALSNSSVAENLASGTTVGTLSTTDPDTGNTFTYAMASGTGSADNGRFNLVGNTLTTNASFDFETKNSYSIRVRATDQGGLWTEKAFTVSVANVNEAPSVTINQAGGQVDPANTSPINFTVVFSAPVTGFANTDVVLGGTAGATTALVTGSGTTYNVAVSGMTQSGTVTATIPANAAVDAVGNPNAGSTSSDGTVTYTPETTPPSVGLTSPISGTFAVGSRITLGATAVDNSGIGYSCYRLAKGGAILGTICQNNVGDGMITSYTWTVPATFNGYTINGTDYQIFVEAWDASPNHNANWAVSGYLTLQGLAPQITVAMVAPATSIRSGSATVSVGSARVGTTGPNKVFRVTNTGNARLTLGKIRVPAGYQLIDGLVASLAPGQSDTFTLRQITKKVGRYTDVLSFSTNVTGTNLFWFTVTGKVTA